MEAENEGIKKGRKRGNKEDMKKVQLRQEGLAQKDLGKEGMNGRTRYGEEGKKRAGALKQRFLQIR